MSAVIDSPEHLLRPMRETDLKGILAIERVAYQYPWTEGIFRDCLRVGYACRVCEEPHSGQLQAYAVMSVAAGESHLLNICVDPQRWGQGLGRKMLRAMLSYARQAKADTAYLEVRPSNTAATALYFAEGFNELGRRNNYYPTANGREDALIMAKVL